MNKEAQSMSWVVLRSVSMKQGCLHLLLHFFFSFLFRTALRHMEVGSSRARGGIGAALAAAYTTAMATPDLSHI